MDIKISKMAKAISPSPTLAIDAKYKSMKAEGIDVVGFGAGEPDFDTPMFIKEAAISAINNNFTRYTPASGTIELKKAICKKFKEDNNLIYEPSNIVVSNGAKHSLINAFLAILDHEDEVIIPAPYWVSYPEMVRIAGGVPILLPTSEESGFKFKAKELESVLSDKTKALVINSPCNPTGVMFSEDELREIADFAVKHNIYVISDEIYESLVFTGQSNISIASFNDKIKDLTIVVNGVSKSYAMTGWRIGYTASNKIFAGAMANIQSHATSNPNSIAQVAATAALNGPKDEMIAMRETFKKRRDYLISEIDKIDEVSCIVPDGAFYVMMNIKKLLNKSYYGVMVKNSDELCDLILEKHKLALVSGVGFGADGYVRWSYAADTDTIGEGINRLKKFINEE